MTREITYELRPVENKELDGQVDVYFIGDAIFDTGIFVCSFYGPRARVRAEEYIATNPR